jgi:CHAT domain-containing protein
MRGAATGFLLGCLLAVALGAGSAAHAASVSDETSIRHWTQAVESHRSRSEPTAWAEALARRAEAYQRLGHRQQALADLEQAAQLLGSETPSPLQAAVLGALGQAQLRAGRTAEAEATLDRALATAERVSAARVAAAVLNDRGTLLALHGRGEDAAYAFTQSAARAVAAGDRIGQARALLNIARLELNRQRPDAAARAAADAIAAARQAGDHADQAMLLVGAGAILRKLARSKPEPALRERARRVLTSATAVAERTASPRAAAEAWGELAELALDEGALADARRLNDRALFHAQATGAADVQFFAQWRAARLMHRIGPTQDALDAYRRALASLARIKTDLAADLWAAQESFTQRIGPAYLGLADLLLRNAAAAADGTARREALREIQHTLESFRQIELEDYFRDDCVARYLARARGIEQVSARTAVLYPVPLADRLELVVTIGEAIHQITVPVGLERLEREARSLRTFLEKRTTYQYLPHARRLYDWILRPLEPVLDRAQVDTLVLVPDRPLRTIPLAALHDGKRFVIARYAVAIAPSLTLVEPRPLNTEAAVVLASGLTQSVQGFAALPYVGAELDALGRLRTGATLRDQAFTTANLEHELRARPYSIVHVASHAQFEADSQRSFVLTYDGRLTIDRLEDQMKRNRYRDQPVELLFLSACQTAAGDERAALGLAGVAVKAGARSALATLWHINDQASSLLVAEFYRHLGQPGVSKAEALRQAQLSLFGDLRYRHPGYWSPFLVIGNWL